MSSTNRGYAPHTTDKTTAQKLAEAGVSVESEFYWCDYKPEKDWKLTDGYLKDGECYPAYTLSELLELLCPNTKVWKGQKLTGGNRDIYCAEHDGHTETAKTAPDAAAKLLLWLIENNHIDPNNLN